MSSLFEQLGGREVLERILRDFYDRVYTDIMIGFMFQRVDKERLIQKELELTARMLGASHIPYTGMPMRPVHAPHRIMGGQFERRQHMLRQVLDDHDVPEAVKTTWLRHTESLRPQITQDPSKHCGELSPPTTADVND